MSNAPTPDAPSPVRGKSVQHDRHISFNMQSTQHTHEQVTATRKYEQFQESLETLQSVVALLQDKVDQLDIEQVRLRTDLGKQSMSQEQALAKVIETVHEKIAATTLSINKVEGALNTRLSNAVAQFDSTNSLGVQVAERVQAIDAEFHKIRSDFAIRLDPHFNRRAVELGATNLRDNLERHE